MSEAREERTVPVTCGVCSSGEDLTRITFTDGDRRRVTMQCPTCGNCETEHYIKHVVEAHVCGGNSTGLIKVGEIWATDPRRGLHAT